MNMIAFDNQLFSIVEDLGFIELSAETEPRYVIPRAQMNYVFHLPHTGQNICNDI